VATGIVLIPAILAVILYAPAWAFTLAAGAIALLTLREYLDLAEKHGMPAVSPIAYLAGAALMVWPAGWAPGHALLVIAVLVLVMLPRRPLEKALGGAAATVFGVLYVALPFALLSALRWSPKGQALVLYVLILTWISDTAAYYAGRSLGRHKLAPRVSPGKTWEGAIGSLLAALVFGYFGMEHILPGVPLWLNLATAGAVNVAGQFGDLAESALKRGAGAKDSGGLLPGHGGLLDRVDALLFAIPVMWYDVTILLRPYLPSAP
jgi:phosphatidate cytidylyltransferase